MTKRWLIVLFSVAAVLRLGFVWTAPAWYDEAFTLVVSRLPFERMLAAVAGDVHPPLWYLLLWPLGQLQAPIWVLRIPAALLSIFSVGIFWSILGVLDLSPRVRTAALVLMTIMPIQLYYAQEARMYALLEFLVLAAVLAMLQHKWGWFWLVSVLMLYTQYYGIFYLITICFVGLFCRVWLDHDEWYWILIYSWFAGMAYAPWAFVQSSQMHNLSGSYWMQLTGPGMVLRVLFDALFMPPQNAVLQIPLMLAGFGWLVVALGYALVKRNKVTGLVSLIAFCPFLFAVLFSLVWQPILHYRPLIAITPFLYILLAGPIGALYDHKILECLDETYEFTRLNLRRVIFVAVFLLPLLLICDGNILANTPKNKASGASVELAYVQAHWQPGDIVYHYSDDSWILTSGNPLPNYKAPDCAPTLGALSPATRAAIGEQIAPLSSLQYKRVWLIWSDGPLNPACSRTQLTALGLDPDKPLLLTQDDEYVYEGLWMVEK